MENDCGKDPLPHHEQLPLCTSRLPYRQGRKFTATKVYTINNESNHLLVFGVPSINIRQETKNLFIKFGKLLKFNITKEYKTEKFTETYHVMYESIKSARIAKKFLDTKNFYGGVLHVCYAPELESIEETRKKLLLRQKGVLYRIANIEKEKLHDNKKTDKCNTEKNVNQNEINPSIININENKKLDMGHENIIYLNNRKRKGNESKINKNKQKSKTYNHNEYSTNSNKPSTSQNVYSTTHNKNSTNQNESDTNNQLGTSKIVSEPIYYNIEPSGSSTSHNKPSTSHNKPGTSHNELSTTENIEIIDFTSTERETISNINEALNYNKFGNEVIKKIKNKTLNRIKFNFNK